MPILRFLLGAAIMGVVLVQRLESKDYTTFAAGIYSLVYACSDSTQPSRIACGISLVDKAKAWISDITP